MSTNIKNSILALFDDNISGAVSAHDLRVFVNTIFDSKENEIHVFKKLTDIDTYRLNPSTVYPISAKDLICITSEDSDAYYKEKGIYIALQDSPTSNDVLKISSENYDEFIKQGLTGQLVSKQDDKLVWIEPIEGYYIEGTALISEILMKKPPQKGPVWIASADDLNAPVPGIKGDGYSFDGENWINVGQLIGPPGDIQDIAFATQSQVNAGIIENKAVSPKTFKNSSIISSKEDRLGFPSNDGDMLVSDTTGARTWETPKKKLEELDDVDLTNLQSASIIVWDGLLWRPTELSNISK